MKNRICLLGTVAATAAVTLALGPLTPATATPVPERAPASALSVSPPSTAAETAALGTVASGTFSSSTFASGTFSLSDRFAREVARYGDSDRSPYSIDHVTELQYRLRWAGVYHYSVTGNFGSITRDAVKRFQRRVGLRQTGVAGHQVWAHLLRQTIRRPGAIPQICKTAGLHACYDRSMHQVTLWRSGVLYNTWLVRGGDYNYQTRLGNTRVYKRDKDHVSGLYGTPMPYSQFFDGGQALHGSGYMTNPFMDHSHGCVNMYIEDARQLWNLTSTKRLYVSVYGAWD